MTGYVRRFTAWLLGLASIVGLYLAAEPLGIVWVFWLVVGVAALLAGGRPTLRFLSNVAIRYRSYGGLLEDRATLTAEVQRLEGAIQHAESVGDDEYARGLADGIHRSQGTSLGRTLTKMPTITGLTLHNDEIAFVATFSGEPPPVGAWLQVQVAATGEIKGAVEAVTVDEAAGRVLLVCCESTVQQYWTRLRARVHEDPSAPNGVRLRAYDLDVRPYFGVASQSNEEDGNDDRG